MKRTVLLLLLALVLSAVSCSIGTLASLLPVVQSVAELAKELCTEEDDALACLRKCEEEQQRREEAR